MSRRRALRTRCRARTWKSAAPWRFADLSSAARAAVRAAFVGAQRARLRHALSSEETTGSAQRSWLSAARPSADMTPWLAATRRAA